MATNCKYEKTIYRVSYDSGSTWQDVIPLQVRKGDLIQYDAQDCTYSDAMYRWRELDGQYLCEDDKKYKKEIREESYDGGLTWYTSYPTVYRKGEYVGVDETFCNDKFVGHYENGEPSDLCGYNYRWNGFKCVYKMDPLKIVKCNSNPVLTENETKYYDNVNFNLFSVYIGDCVTAIGDYAFAGRSSISAITIPSGVTSIGNDAFSNCSSLSAITIPSGVTTIGTSAFASCSGLTSIDIPSGVTTIGEYAFMNCSGLTSITVNATTPPTLGGSDVFRGTTCPIYVPCESLSLYKTASKWKDYDRIIGIPPCDIAIKIETTYNNYIKTYKFCNSATTLTTGDTKLSDYSYSAMTDAQIGNCITAIGESAFMNCSNLTSVTIPNSVTSIGSSAFNGCGSLTSIDIPSGVTFIGSDAFASCSGLTSVVIPSGVTVINCFRYCSSLSSVTIPDNVTWIGGFEDCTSLTSIDIPNSVTTIGYMAFYNCRSLTSIVIPSGVTTIGGYAFQNCSGLTSITVNATTPPTLGSGVFTNTNNCLIYVPSASVETYNSASGWSDYSSRIQAIQNG